MVIMKATIEFDDELYRRLKIEAAVRNTRIRELVEAGVRLILDGPDPVRTAADPASSPLPIVRKSGGASRKLPALSNEELEGLLASEDLRKAGLRDGS